MGYNRRVSQFISSLRIGPITSYVLVAAVVMTLSLHLLKERKIYSVSENFQDSTVESRTATKSTSAEIRGINQKDESAAAGNLTSLENLQRPIHLIVVASAPRSGSSFLGDLLASPMQGLLFYEPFWYFRRGQGHKPIIKDIIDPEADKYVPKDLRKLLLCQMEELPDMFNIQLGMKIWRKPKISAPLSSFQRAKVCKDLKLRVIKVVRPKLSSVLPILEDPDLNAYVIHLVRDPRGIINSLASFTEWLEALKPQKACVMIRNDLQASVDFSGHPRLRRVRYEDLVANPEFMSKQIFNWMKLQVPLEVNQFLDRHTRQIIADPSSNSTKSPANSASADNFFHSIDGSTAASDTAKSSSSRSLSSPTSSSDGNPAQKHKTTKEPKLKTSTLSPKAFKNAYSTIREATFDGLHWITELDPALRKKTERDCRDILRYLDYPLVYPQEKVLQTEEVHHTTA